MMEKPDVFDYSSHLLHRLARAHDPAAPLQIELHPGLHCDLYRCPHCYGLGQAVLAGRPVTAAEIDSALADIAAFRPTVIVSGITTEPLTNPDAAGIIRAIKRRNLTLGVYTKGRRLDQEMCDALVAPGGHTFVTLSLDGVTREEYISRHGLPEDRRDGLGGVGGGDYFHVVLDGLARLRAARDAAGSQTEIRGAFLLFGDNAHEATIEAALELYGSQVDLLRFALPQQRNDGAAPGALPEDPQACLERLEARFRSEPKVRILSQTSESTRDPFFNRCWAQRFQVVIDKTGNVFPCPQVAVAPHRGLSYGNIRTTRLSDLLTAQKRSDMFGFDVDTQMKCRICDRKDEALNTTLSRLAMAFGAST